MPALSPTCRHATDEFLGPVEYQLDLVLHKTFLEATGFDLGGWSRTGSRLSEALLTLREVPDDVREHYARPLDELLSDLDLDVDDLDAQDPDEEPADDPAPGEYAEYEIRLADLAETCALDPEDAAVLTALVESAMRLADARALLHRDR